MLKEKWKRTWSKMAQLEDYCPEVFVRCQWQRDEGANFFYMVYRWIFALIFCCGLLASLLDIGRETSGITYLKWPVYLTNWGYTVCTIQAIMAAYHVTQYYNSSRGVQDKTGELLKMKTSYSVYWVLHSISVVGAIGITSIYWTAVYNPVENKLDMVNLTVHLFNTVLMLIDLSMVAHPTKLIHSYWALSFASCYIVFNALYYLAGGTDRKGKVYIYSIMDWRRPLRAVLASVTGLAFLMLVTVAVWFFSICRRRFAAHLLNLNITEECRNIKDIPQTNNLPHTSLKVIRMV
ncbi:headbutt isoform X2 [Lycorma delicatula]